MANTPIDERRFTDEEVHEILKKAVEKAPARALAKSEGVSLAELKVIGEEVGIDPARLEAAARTVTLGVGERPNRILGGPTILNFERKVEGEFDPEDTPEILSIIRRTMGQQGKVEKIHGSLEWRASAEAPPWSPDGAADTRYVTISSRDGITTIFSSCNLSPAAAATYLPVGLAGLMTSFVGLVKFAKSGSEVALIVGLSALAALPLLYPILRTIFGRISRSESAKLQQMMDELARLAEGTEDGPPLP